MITETILTDEDLDRCTDFLNEVPYDVDYDLDHIYRACRNTEQAVLQSPEVQELLAERDALRDALETMVEMVKMNGFGRDYAMDVARAAIEAAPKFGEEEE